MSLATPDSHLSRYLVNISRSVIRLSYRTSQCKLCPSLAGRLLVNFLDILSNSFREFSRYLVELTLWICWIFCGTDSANFLDFLSNWLDEFYRYLVELTRWILSMFCRTVWILSISCRADSVNFLDIFRIESVNFLDVLLKWLDEFSRYFLELTRRVIYTFCRSSQHESPRYLA